LVAEPSTAITSQPDLTSKVQPSILFPPLSASR
jgi:hypothetical protein